MTLATRDSGKCPVPMNIYRAPLSLPQRACSVHSKSEGPFLERVSEVTCYRTALLWFPLGDQPGAGFRWWARAVWVLAGCSHLLCLPAFLNHSFLYTRFPQTWAWAWGWAGRTPRVITSKAVPPALSQMTIIFTVTFPNAFCQGIQALCNHNGTMKMRNGVWHDMKNCIFHLLSMLGKVYYHKLSS